MANESKPPARAFRRFALALITCLALVGVAASSASAVGLELTAGSFPQPVVVSGGYFQATPTNDLRVVACNGGLTGEGELSSKSTGELALALHGCYMSMIGGNASCTSSGAKSGTIVTNSLAANLAKLPEGKSGSKPPGIVLRPVGSNTFAKFSCGAYGTIEWSGGLIGEITKPVYGGAASTELAVKFIASGSSQQYTRTYHGQKAHLVSEREGWEAEEMGLEGSATISFANAGVEAKLSEAEELHFAKFPHALSVVGGELALQGAESPIKCTTSIGKSGEFIFGVSGSGEFSSPTSGKVQLTLHNCKDSVWGAYCTSAGQAEGTVKTEWLPIQLTYLADSSPGMSFKANETSGKVAQIECLGGFVGVALKGSGVLGKIVSPSFGEEKGLEVEVNAIEGKGQEYTKTEAGETLGLQQSINGNKAESVSMNMSDWFSSGELPANPLFRLSE